MFHISKRNIYPTFDMWKLRLAWENNLTKDVLDTCDALALEAQGSTRGNGPFLHGPYLVKEIKK